IDTENRRKFLEKNIRISNRILLENREKDGYSLGFSDNYIQYAVKNGEQNVYKKVKGNKVIGGIIYE
ncbi:hypothetical protein J7L48_02960, partial [bacterium]|nr:hypothetical protein [bacterium]